VSQDPVKLLSMIEAELRRLEQQRQFHEGIGQKRIGVQKDLTRIGARMRELEAKRDRLREAARARLTPPGGEA
jgi:hypothetical protein